MPKWVATEGDLGVWLFMVVCVCVCEWVYVDLGEMFGASSQLAGEV